MKLLVYQYTKLPGRSSLSVHLLGNRGPSLSTKSSPLNRASGRDQPIRAKSTRGAPSSAHQICFCYRFSLRHKFGCSEANTQEGALPCLQSILLLSVIRYHLLGQQLTQSCRHRFFRLQEPTGICPHVNWHK